jgi:elongation factor 1-beta
VKPWDDETDMQKLEEAVRSVKMEGLLWGACMPLFSSIMFYFSKKC